MLLHHTLTSERRLPLFITPHSHGRLMAAPLQLWNDLFPTIFLLFEEANDAELITEEINLLNTDTMLIRNLSWSLSLLEKVYPILEEHRDKVHSNNMS